MFFFLIFNQVPHAYSASCLLCLTLYLVILWKTFICLYQYSYHRWHCIISTFFCVLCHFRIFKYTWRLRLIKISLIVRNILALNGIPTIVNRIHWSLQEMSPRTTMASAVFTPFRQAVMTLIVLRPWQA